MGCIVVKSKPTNNHSINFHNYLANKIKANTIKPITQINVKNKEGSTENIQKENSENRKDKNSFNFIENENKVNKT